MASVLCSPCKNPFCLYATVAAGINIGNIVVGARAVPTVAQCKGSTWLVVNLAFAVAHIVAAVHVARAVGDRDNRRLAAAGKTTALGRAGHLLCHDPWMGAYLVVLLVYFIWLWVGVSWKTSRDFLQGGGCNANVGEWMNTGIICGFAFFLCSSWALFFNLCYVWCCDKSDYSPNPPSEQPGFVKEEQGKKQNKQENKQEEEPDPAPSAPAEDDDIDVEAGKGGGGGGGSGGDESGGSTTDDLPTALNDSIVPVPPPPAETEVTVPVKVDPPKNVAAATTAATVY